MKLNEFLKTQELNLKVFVCCDGSYRVGFTPSVEIYEHGFLTSECGDSSKDILTAIKNTLKNISNKRLKIDNKRYVNILEVEL